MQGDLYVSGSIDGGNKGRLASRFVLLMVNQNHLILNIQVKKDGDLDMLVLKLRWVYIVEVELEKIIKLPDYWKDLVDVESILFSYNQLIFKM